MLPSDLLYQRYLRANLHLQSLDRTHKKKQYSTYKTFNLHKEYLYQTSSMSNNNTVQYYISESVMTGWQNTLTYCIQPGWQFNLMSPPAQNQHIKQQIKKCNCPMTQDSNPWGDWVDSAVRLYTCKRGHVSNLTPTQSGCQFDRERTFELWDERCSGCTWTFSRTKKRSLYLRGGDMRKKYWVRSELIWYQKMCLWINYRLLCSYNTQQCSEAQWSHWSLIIANIKTISGLFSH